MSVQLTAKTYLEKIGDPTRLHRDVILTPHPWVAIRLMRRSDHLEENWKTNGAKIFRSVPIGNRTFDILVCLPGASMAVITLEESIAAGAVNVIFIGTGGSIEGKIAPGSIVKNANSISVLNPFTEHEKWAEVGTHDTVDMESTYLRAVAKSRHINFDDALIITDHIWKDRWENLIQTEEYTANLAESFEKLPSLL